MFEGETFGISNDSLATLGWGVLLLVLWYYLTKNTNTHPIGQQAGESSSGKGKQKAFTRTGEQSPSTELAGEEENKRESDLSRSGDRVGSKELPSSGIVPEPKTPTKKDFHNLIKVGNPAVSWVGGYTIAHGTGIEIGFLKKEAMALTTLMSYYQVDGGGATRCPVAMISGNASLGRKLAIFYSSCETGQATTRLGRWESRRERVPLGVVGIGFSLGLDMLAKLGRADSYLRTLMGYLKRSQWASPRVLRQTQEGRLILTTALGEDEKAEMDTFVREIFQSGQLDVANLLTRDLQFDTVLLVQLCGLAMRNGHLPLAELLFDREPEIVRGGPHCLARLLSLALLSEDLEMVQLCVRNGADANQLDTTDRDHNSPLHLAILGKGAPRYSNYYGSNYWVSQQELPVEVIQFLLENGAKVDVKNERGASPISMAAEAGCTTTVELLKKHSKEHTEHVK